MTGVLGGVFGVARSFSHSYWLYICLEFLEAFIGDCCSPAYILSEYWCCWWHGSSLTCYLKISRSELKNMYFFSFISVTEVVSTKQRLKFILMCTIGYTFGGFATSVAAWLVPYWRTLLQVLYTPALLFFFYKYLLDESPRWLLIKGHKKKAVEVLEKAAMKNNLKLDKHFLDKLSCENNETLDFFKIIKSTFQSKVLCGRFFVCLVWWTTSTFVNYGLTITSVSLQGNKYINFALLSVVDLPGLFIITYILTYCKRKLPLICCFFAAAVLCVSQPFVPLGMFLRTYLYKWIILQFVDAKSSCLSFFFSDLPWLSIVFFMAGKLMSSFYFNITYLYTSELFPTYTRNSMHALCSSLGRIGSIISPQTPLLVSFLLLHISLFLCYFNIWFSLKRRNDIPSLLGSRSKYFKV